MINWNVIIPIAIQIGFGIIVSVFGFFIKRELIHSEQKIDNMSKKQEELSDTVSCMRDHVDAAVSKLQDDHNSFKLKATETFVTKTEFSSTIGEILKKLDRIYDRLFDMNGSEKGGQ
jgi:uncharacterized coiled-coil protein SlyX